MQIVPARAKINLGLSVIRRRDDGWHDIDTVMVPLDWHDLVAVEIIATGRSQPIRLSVTGATSGLGAVNDNLAFRAASAAIAAWPVQPAPGLDVWVHKRLPVAAGLGGGSADAAAVLRAVAMLATRSRCRFDPDELARIAATLGSDVPALLADRPCRAQRRGEAITVAAVPELWVAVAILAAAATPAAYQGLRPSEIGPSDRIERLLAAMRGGAQPDNLLLGSGLEGAACRASPRLAESMHRLRGRSSLPWHLTGSGGAVFTVHRDRSAADAAVADANGLGFPARVCRSVGG